MKINLLFFKKHVVILLSILLFLGWTGSRVFAQDSSIVLHLTFDNTSLTDVSGHGGDGTSYGAHFINDRFGHSNSALDIYSDGKVVGSAANLPLGNSPRTISFWANIYGYEESSGIVFCYGNCTPNGTAFGIMITQFCNEVCDEGLRVFSYGYGNDFDTPYLFPIETWMHLAVTYDGTNLKAYVNGALKNNTSVNWNTTAGANIYSLGDNTPYLSCQNPANRFTGYIDDFIVYNKALSVEEIIAIVNGSSMGINDKNLSQINIFPNPASDYLCMNGAEKIKFIQIKDISGRTVKTMNNPSNIIPLNDIDDGVYFIIIMDNKGDITTKKFSCVKK